MQTSVQPPPEKSTWQSKYRALGPGILMATAAIGGSHIIASTQAGAIYGWQLAIIIILVNLCKYPFFRFGSQYTLASGQNLLLGYRQKGLFYLWLFFLLNSVSTVVNIAAVGLLTSTILSFALPFKVDMTVLSVLLICFCALLVMLGRFRLLDGLSKIIMLTLTVATVVAVAIAAARGSVAAPDYVAASPYNLATLGFIVALMGWMPAPIEVSVLTSLWMSAKQKLEKVSYQDGIFDFNVGFISTALLALVFLALGALVQYGTGDVIAIKGAEYISQLIHMYTSTIGQWSRLLIIFIAFGAMFGTTITVIDGYARACAESVSILSRDALPRSQLVLNIFIAVYTVAALLLVLFFKASIAPLLTFAMVSSFLTTPIFAFLNLRLVLTGEHRVRGWLLWLSIGGIIYLTGFALLFLANYMKLIG